MRFESSILSVSWIPSEAITGLTRLPFEVGIIRYDDPPPDTMPDFKALVASDRVRFANELRAWVEVEGSRIVDAGYAGQGHMNISTVHLGRMGISFPAVRMPDIDRPLELGGESVTFVRTAGGRTGLPAPRHVHGKPYVQLSAPPAWTTLSLTIDKDGSSRGKLTGASQFPRHWVYDDSMSLTSKAGSIDFKGWYRESFGTKSPWGDTDLPAFSTVAETTLERAVSLHIMRGGQRPARRTLSAGDILVEQHQPGGELFLLLDGVVAVDVDGRRVAEVGPGAILGERALLEGGTRTSTLRAVTACRVAVASARDLNQRWLEEISAGHRREDSNT